MPWLVGMYPGSDDVNKPSPEPRPALALACAAVERALTYVAEGRITLETIQADREKTGFLIIADINPTTQKRSTTSVAFSDDLWGTNVQGYLHSIKKLYKKDLDAIIAQARKLSRATASQNHDDDDDDELYLQRLTQRTTSNARAQIPLNYGVDEDDDDDSENADDSGAEDAGGVEENGVQQYKDGDEGMYEDSMEAYLYEDGHAEYDMAGGDDHTPDDQGVDYPAMEYD